jgi:hypothetical protein
MIRFGLAVAMTALCCGSSLAAENAVSCGGVAMLGAAQLNCSHVNAKAPPQLCTYSWSLHSTTDGQKVVDGSFMIPPGAVNIMVYQGSGFDTALSQPIILCRGEKS